MKDVITSREDVFLAKIAGRDVDINTLTPPVATSVTEKLLLETADRLDRIEENGGGGGGSSSAPILAPVQVNLVIDHPEYLQSATFGTLFSEKENGKYELVTVSEFTANTVVNGVVPIVFERTFEDEDEYEFIYYADIYCQFELNQESSDGTAREELVSVQNMDEDTLHIIDPAQTAVLTFNVTVTNTRH